MRNLLLRISNFIASLLVFLLMATAWLIILAFIAMHSWNWLAPMVDLPTLNLTQALCITAVLEALLELRELSSMAINKIFY